MRASAANVIRSRGDSTAEEDDRHFGRGYGEGDRVERRKADAGGEQDDRYSPAALTQEARHPGACAVGQGVTVKAEAPIDLAERRRVRGP